MSHAPSLLSPSQMSTTSPSTLSICTPVRPTIRPSTRPPLTLSSHGDYACADPSNSSFGPVMDSTSPSGYEFQNLIEDSSMDIKPMFFFHIFHKPNMTSTYDTSESISTPPPKSDVDDDQIRNMLASPLYSQEREASADRSLVYHSFREKSVSSSSHFRVQGNLPRCYHFKESRVKTHFPTEKAFPQDIKQFREEVNLSSGSLMRKRLRGQFLKNEEIINSQKRNLKS